MSISFFISPGKNYGTVLIPEGLVDSIPELRLLISEIDGVFAECDNTQIRKGNVVDRMSLILPTAALACTTLAIARTISACTVKKIENED